MTRYAKVENEKVTAVTDVEPGEPAPEGTILAPDEVESGWVYIAGRFGTPAGTLDEVKAASNPLGDNPSPSSRRTR